MQTVTRALTSVRSEPIASSPRPLHVVLVDEELPYPPTSGKRIRTLNLTLRLARRHQLTYVCHRNADAEEARQAAAFFAGQGIETVVVDRVGAAEIRGRASTCDWRPICCRRCPTRWRRRQPALRRALRGTRAPSTRSICGTANGRPTPRRCAASPHGRRLVIAHNVESVIWQRYYETETNPLRRWYIGRQWRKFQRFERRVMGEVERTVAVSAVDARAIPRATSACARGRGGERRRYRLFPAAGVPPRGRAVFFSSAVSTGGRISTACNCCSTVSSRRCARPSRRRGCVWSAAIRRNALRQQVAECPASNCMAACRTCGRTLAELRHARGAAADRRRLAAQDSRSAGERDARRFHAHRRRGAVPGSGPPPHRGGRHRRLGRGVGRRPCANPRSCRPRPSAAGRRCWSGTTGIGLRSSLNECGCSAPWNRRSGFPA